MRSCRYLTLVWHYLYHFLMPPEETPSSQFALQRGAGSMFNMSSGVGCVASFWRTASGPTMNVCVSVIVRPP